MAKPVEQGITKDATPLAKGDTTGSLNRPPSRGLEPPAGVTPLVRVRPRKTEAKSDIAEQIGQRLRNVYNEILFQPIPERFHELMRALEKEHAAAPNEPADEADSGRTKDSK